MAPSSKLSLGIKKASRSHSYHRRGLWALKSKHGGAFPKAEKPAAAGEPKFYPADDVKPRKPSTRKPKPTKLRFPAAPWFLRSEFLAVSCESSRFLMRAGRPSLRAPY